VKKINFCEYRNLIVNLSDYYGNNFQLYNKQESQQKEGGGGTFKQRMKISEQRLFYVRSTPISMPYISQKLTKGLFAFLNGN
jgi:hypothetical protein